jgi:hypothetical protein
MIVAPETPGYNSRYDERYANEDFEIHSECAGLKTVSEAEEATADRV